MSAKKIVAVHQALLSMESSRDEPSFPGMVVGEDIVYIPEWSDGMMLWGNLWALSFGPFLLACNNMGRRRLFLSPARCASYMALV